MYSCHASIRGTCKSTSLMKHNSSIVEYLTSRCVLFPISLSVDNQTKVCHAFRFFSGAFRRLGARRRFLTLSARLHTVSERMKGRCQRIVINTRFRQFLPTSVFYPFLSCNSTFPVAGEFEHHHRRITQPQGEA